MKNYEHAYKKEMTYVDKMIKLIDQILKTNAPTMKGYSKEELPIVRKCFVQEKTRLKLNTFDGQIVEKEEE